MFRLFKNEPFYVMVIMVLEGGRKNFRKKNRGGVEMAYYEKTTTLFFDITIMVSLFT